jgi:hypothetical protein
MCLKICAIFILLMAIAQSAAASEDEVDLLFDFGIPDTPIAAGATPVHPDHIYHEEGYGWLDFSPKGFNHETTGLSEKGDKHHPLHLVSPGRELYQDGVEDSKPIRFQSSVKPGVYLVTVFMGQYHRPCHDMILRINNTTVMENVDAWGNIWGSQGGTPVKSIKAVVNADDGVILIEIDHSPQKPESWKEYAYGEPEGGKLWYLPRENRSSAMGVRIRGMPDWKIRSAQYQMIFAALYKQDIHRATKHLEELPESNKHSLDFVIVSDTVAGHIDTPDDRRIEFLQDSLERLSILRENGDRSAEILERIEVDKRLLTALRYLRMWGFQSANQQTGLNIYHRYWGAYDLCNAVAPDDPLYALSLLIRMRVSYWNGREGGWKHCYDLARQHAEELLTIYPGHALIRMYLGERIPQIDGFLPAPPGTPRWAVLQRTAISRLRKVIHYWVENRQRETGELGGGWGDDVEILRSWASLVLSTHDEISRAGAKRIAHGIYASGVVEDGFTRGIGDVEHAAEPVSDTQPLMMAADYGNPLFYENCLATMRCMHDVWTGLNDSGNLQFRSHYYSATKVDENPPRSADVPLNGRAVKPGVWVVWYSGNPAVRDMLSQWCMTWIKAARRTDDGKPVGILPGSISFPEGRPGGYAERWWQTKDYFSDLPAMGYTATLYHILLAVWVETQNETYLEPMFAALEAVRVSRELGNKEKPQGSLEWVGAIHDTGKFFDVVSKWRILSGDESYDDLILNHANGSLYYRLTGDISRLEKELESIIQGLSSNLPMITSEVLFTDRVSIPGSTALTSMMSGSFGNPTYYPLHAVTWDGIGEKAAVFVQKAERKSLKAQIYAFPEEDSIVSMRLWRLAPGIYELIQEGNSSEKRSIHIKERGQEINLTIPGQMLTTIYIKQLNRVPQPDLLPDLAIGDRDIEHIRPGTLRIRIHNIGAAPVPPFRMRVFFPDDSFRDINCSGLPASDGFSPVIQDVNFGYPDDIKNGIFTIVLDPDNEVGEIFEGNNQVGWLLLNCMVQPTQVFMATEGIGVDGISMVLMIPKVVH